MTITNNGSQSLTLTTVKAADGSDNSFAVDGSKCTGAAIAVMKTCIISVTFTPTVTGSKTATIQLSDSNNDRLPTISVTGTGIVTFTQDLKAESVGTNYTVNVSASGFSGTVDIASSDKALLSPSTLSMPKGEGSFTVQFVTEGKQTLTLKDEATSNPHDPVTFTYNVTSSSADALKECGSCYATIGTGVVLAKGYLRDYQSSSNVLGLTHLGNGVPDLAVGIAYKLGIPGIPWFKPRTGHTSCDASDFNNPKDEATAAYCYPFKVFISLKIAPESSQTLNGFTYGLSHALHKRLDLLVGISYSAYNEISPGFQQAAVQTVIAQQAASNPYYARYDPVAMANPKPRDAFDGFPTQLISNAGAAGALIYSGNVLETHYHSGVFFGVAIPLAFRVAASGGS